MDSYTVGTVVIFCSITWIIASPFVVFYYHKRYITAYRELEELRREVSPAVDIQSTQMSASEGAQSTNKQPITENRSNPVTPLSDHELLTKIRSMSPYNFEKYIAQLFEHLAIRLQPLRINATVASTLYYTKTASKVMSNVKSILNKLSKYPKCVIFMVQLLIIYTEVKHSLSRQISSHRTREDL